MFEAIVNSHNFIFLIPIVAIICGTIASVIEKNQKAKHSPEETKIMQEIHKGLSRLEQRIEALETILFEQKH